MKVLLLFPDPIQPVIRKIKEKINPRERLYGFYELLDDAEFTIIDSDSRFSGTKGKIVRFFRGYGVNLVDLKTLAALATADVIVVKDNVSFMVSLAAKLMNKPVIYYDALFPISEKKIKQFFLKKNLAWCAKIVGYNSQQIEDYENQLGIELKHKYLHLDFPLDEVFYKNVYDKSPDPNEYGYVLSIGRDMGRDFSTLIQAAAKTNIKVKIVTLPYLLQDIRIPENVEILQNVSYEELFTLYKGAGAVVVPLKKGLSYASGIRAIMESVILGKKTIVSETPFVTNNCSKLPNLTIVDPQNVDKLATALVSVEAHNPYLLNPDVNLIPKYSDTAAAVKALLLEYK